jgi:hypothetical protein
MPDKLIFVYNADSGLFNTLTDIAHKALSPQTYACNLCAITHSYFSMRDAWKDFLTELGAECEFLHRDQFRARFPSLDTALPVVLREAHGTVHICLPAEAINQCKDMDALKQRIIDHCLTPPT